jgi:hypothetical protein
LYSPTKTASAPNYENEGERGKEPGVKYDYDRLYGARRPVGHSGDDKGEISQLLTELELEKMERECQGKPIRKQYF